MGKKKLNVPVDDLDEKSYLGLNERFETDSDLSQWDFLDGYSKGYNEEI